MFARRIVLGIESSCDDTCAALVRGCGAILGEAKHSQLRVHQKTGGVDPSVAGKLHRQNLEHVTELAVRASGCSLSSVSAIAVTRGPGLALCLSAGLDFAKTLAKQYNKPLIPIHHMEAHALTPRLETHVPFPYLVLLVSGGHCILAVVRGVGEFDRLGECLDDSPGEALDKLARWMKLELHPEVGTLAGGAAIEQLAKTGVASLFKLPHVMSSKRCCNFSFAGLKTIFKGIIAQIKSETGWEEGDPLPGCQHVAAAFQTAVCRHLITRTHRALLFCQKTNIPIKHLVVSGGVASNSYLYEQLALLGVEYGVTVLRPKPALCTDNGVMIAWAALEQLQHSAVRQHQTVEEDMDNLRFLPRWPLGVDVSQRVTEMDIKVRKSKD